LNRATQQIFKVGNQTAREPGGCFAGHVYQEIDIALTRVITARHRPEKEHVSSSMSRHYAKDLIAAVVDVLPGTHFFAL
jgi:hypothetical protein